MSLANAASGAGAAAISSRKRSAEITRDTGGEIKATAAPLRVTSISSPFATRLSSSEKLRAASVAVIRVTRAEYQINLIDIVRPCFVLTRSIPRAPTRDLRCADSATSAESTPPRGRD